MTERPRYQPTFTLGNMVQTALLVASIAGGWALLEARSQENEEAISREALARSQALSRVADQLSSMDSRTRFLEQQSARADERFTSILSYLTRIDGRLERIEREGND